MLSDEELYEYFPKGKMNLEKPKTDTKTPKEKAEIIRNLIVKGWTISGINDEQ